MRLITFILLNLIYISNIISQINFNVIRGNIPTDINIMLDGDSQFTTLNCAGCISPSVRIDSSYNFLIKKKVYNNSISGQNTSQMLSNIQVHLTNNYDISYINNVCVLWCGVNDIVEKNWNTDTIYDMLMQSVNLARLSGFKVFVMTLNYIRVSAHSSPLQEIEMDSIAVLNTKIINGDSLYGYNVIRNDLYDKWDSRTDMNNKLYFVDGVHRTDYGLLILSDFIYNEINQYLE